MSYLRGLSGFIVGAGLGGAGLVAVMAVAPEDAIPTPNVDVAVVDTTVEEGAEAIEKPAQPEVEIKTPTVKEEKPAVTETVTEESKPIVPTPKAEEVAKKKEVKVPAVKNKPEKVKLPVVDADAPKKETGITIGKKPKSSLPTIEAKVETPKPTVEKAETKIAGKTTPKDVKIVNALQQNAIGFSGSDRPKLAIILRDVGDKGLSVSQLKSLNAPITIAISSNAPNATARAQEFKAAGFEVIAMTSDDRNSALKHASNPSQVKNALDAIFQKVPSAIGLVDNTFANLQKNSRTAGVVIENFTKTGHGLITYAKGLNAVDRAVVGTGVHAAKVARILDANRENKAIIIRYLDRVALDAGRDGSGIVIGTTAKDTVIALAGWVLSSKGQSVALAPASAVLLGR